MTMWPRYPIYVPSKGRASTALTPRFLIEDDVPFYLVVEESEADEYARRWGRDRLLVLPFSDLGQGSIPARNFIWEHAESIGAGRHWVVDDNIWKVYRNDRGTQVRCHSGTALRCVEDFADRYENVGIAGLNYDTFRLQRKPFVLNAHVYSCMLIDTSLPCRWRGRYNEDVDLCLQTLSRGYCTVNINVFLIFKTPTLSMRGGNTDDLYLGHGKMKKARALERKWPRIVRVTWRFGRPHHFVDWKRFRMPLKRREDIDWDALPETDEYDLELRYLGDPKARWLKQWAEQFEERQQQTS